MATNNEATVTANQIVSEQENTQETSESSSVCRHQLSFEFECMRPDFCYATVIVPAAMVDELYHEAAQSQQKSAQTYGFHHGEVPLDYIKQNFTENLTEHVKELLFKYCVVNYLYEQIRLNKLVVVGDPRLTDITLRPQKDARFVFEVSLFPDLSIYEWKYFPFKAPKRKNYKDLDRQVDSFIEEEKKRLHDLETDKLSEGDWVGFNLAFVEKENKLLLDGFVQNFWFKIGPDETESPLRQIFIGKKEGDRFHSNHHALQMYFSDQLDTQYLFDIEITGVLSYHYFCFDHFKKIFRIKTNKDMHKKLIEVFSYRQDISQRHAMVEESLHALLSKHKFSAPNHLILRQQKGLLERIQHNPDYHVYRAEKDFHTHVRNLAEKQVVETIFVDKLAYNENLALTDEDIKGYLNLTNRHRMKEFIYFDIPSFKIQGQEAPIPSEELKRICLREKAINYVIYHLTKK